MRAVALAVLIEVMENGAYANISLRKALGRVDTPVITSRNVPGRVDIPVITSRNVPGKPDAPVITSRNVPGKPDTPAGQIISDPRGRAFVTELVNETLRNLLYIDTVINYFSKLSVDKMKPVIRNLLRITVCQLRILTKIPPHAAVHEAVELAKANGLEKLSGFVNGVLRAVVRNADKPAINENEWAAHYSFSSGLAADLTRWLGEETAREFARNSHMIPAVTVFVNTMKITPGDLIERLQAEGVEVFLAEDILPDMIPGTTLWEIPFTDNARTHTFLDRFLLLRHTGDISALTAFREGLFFVMDPGAITAVTTLRLRPGQSLLDMCAAPGGKSFAAACIMGDSVQIKAYDIHPHRVELMELARKRLGLASITTHVQDATQVHPPDTAAKQISTPNMASTQVASSDIVTMKYESPAVPQFDAVLLDAPCSGLGTLRKRPEIKLRYDGIDPALLETQRTLLKSAAMSVKPGGVLVYATCTVSQEENSGMVQWFCKNHPQFITEECTQLLPGTYNDGFFVARLRRRDE